MSEHLSSSSSMPAPKMLDKIAHFGHSLSVDTPRGVQLESRWSSFHRCFPEGHGIYLAAEPHEVTAPRGSIPGRSHCAIRYRERQPTPELPGLPGYPPDRLSIPKRGAIHCHKWLRKTCPQWAELSKYVLFSKSRS